MRPHDPLPSSFAADSEAFVLAATGASGIARVALVQPLWGGYGSLWRVWLRGSALGSVILKDVRPPPSASTEGAAGHARKRRSYEVEVAFYERYAAETSERCRVARPYAAVAAPGRWRLLLEDLDASGFGERARRGAAALDGCVRWLAAFHARFLGRAPEGLWATGTYWHLATRGEELARTVDSALVAHAALFDRALEQARFKTWVHGDAKPANFCFDLARGEVAAVDFQYVGGGCGARDLAYLLHGEGSREAERALVDHYFAELRRELAGREVDVASLEAEWRALYEVAHADFSRFLAGWSPGALDPGERARALSAVALARRACEG